MIAENTLNLLEFPKLLRVISTFSHSNASEKAVLDIFPLNDQGEIETRLGRIAEIRRMSHEGSPLKLTQFSDVAPLLHTIRPEGAVLESTELSAFMPFLAIVDDISSRTKEQEAIPFLSELTARLTGFPDILALLKRSMDSEGAILDSASPALSELRGQVRRLEGG